MTVAELREELNKYYNGDRKVVVKYRDSGGEYEGVDDELYLSFEEIDGEVVLLL